MQKKHVFSRKDAKKNVILQKIVQEVMTSTTNINLKFLIFLLADVSKCELFLNNVSYSDVRLMICEQ